MRAIVRTHFEIELSQAKTSIAEEYETAWIGVAARSHPCSILSISSYAYTLAYASAGLEATGY